MKVFFQTHILRQASYIIMTFNQTLNVNNILAYTFFIFLFFYNYNYIIIIYHIYIALFSYLIKRSKVLYNSYIHTVAYILTIHTFTHYKHLKKHNNDSTIK